MPNAQCLVPNSMKDHRPYFQKTIKKYFPANGGEINCATDKEFDLLRDDISFAATSKNMMDRRMGVAGYFLSLIKVLDKKGESFETIRKICIEVATDYVQPKNKFQAWMKKLPPKIMTNPIAHALLTPFYNAWVSLAIQMVS
jgi:hypothetical protein